MLQSELRCQIRSSSGHGLDITASENGLVGGSSTARLKKPTVKKGG
jgi:hypothetical protein